MTKNSEYAGWSIRDLNNAIASDEGVLRKEGDRNFSVDRFELEAMRNERVGRIFGR
jgi:hypothetical protein